MIQKENLDLLSNVLSLQNPEINFTHLQNILTAAKHNEDLKEDIFDSLSENQFKSKFALLKAIESLNLLNGFPTVIIWGCWYGSIIIPLISKRANKIIGIDMDERVIQIAKNKLFHDYGNVELIADDIFATHRDVYLKTDLIINTSCEHMLPMKEWHWFRHGAIKTDPIYPEGFADDQPNKKRVFNSPKLSSHCHFAFQSNNMKNIDGHINCVTSLEEFKSQLPERAEVLIEEVVEDDRGLRFMLVGKLN